MNLIKSIIFIILGVLTMAVTNAENTKIAVVYHSGYGHTKRVAEHVAKGVESISGVEVSILSVEEATRDMDKLDTLDGIIFGAPTYMGGASADFKKFADTSSKKWFEGKWKDKIAAGFTNSGSLSGDKLSTLQFMVTFAMQHGMIWVGQAEKAPTTQAGHGATPTMINRIGSWLGLMTQSDQADADKTPSTGDLETAKLFGKRVAEITKKWKKVE